MLAAVYRRPGGADVLSVEEVQTPEPGPGEVRVRLRVAGVNPTDWKSRTRTPPEGFQVPGQDGAGEVDAVGPGVDPGRVGERVWVWFAAARGRRWGTAAQWTVVSARQAVPLPDGVPLELGAGLGIPAMTAHQCLFVDGPLDGATVLVAGGAGASGTPRSPSPPGPALGSSPRRAPRTRPTSRGRRGRTRSSTTAPPTRLSRCAARPPTACPEWLSSPWGRTWPSTSR